MNNTSSVATTSSNISYNGFLNIKLKHNGKVFPFIFVNSGTQFLFDTLTKFLAGYTVYDSVPKYFDFQTAVSTNTYVTCLKSKIRLTGGVYGELAGANRSDRNEDKSAEGRVMYSAVITYDDKLLDESLNSPRVVLKDSSNNIIAFIENPQLQTVWDSIVKGTEAILEWTMVFKNESKNG